MKTGIVLICMMAACHFCIAQVSNETLAIEKTCQNYLDGWYSGDTLKMENALHENLVKRRKIVLKETGTDLINQVTTLDMIEYTKAGFGKLRHKEGLINDIEILDIYNDIATVKTISGDYIDYIHLVKFNGEWKILNVLWEVRN